MFGMEWLKPETLITSFGAFAMIGVMLIVFVETGLLVGFFLVCNVIVGNGASIIAKFHAHYS